MARPSLVIGTSCHVKCCSKHFSNKNYLEWCDTHTTIINIMIMMSNMIMIIIQFRSYIVCQLQRHYHWQKISPATRHGGAWGERRYRSCSFLTSALDGGEWSASRPGYALPLGKGSPVPIVQDDGWAPEPVWTQSLERKKKFLCPCRGSNLDLPVVQSVVRHYTDWATRLHNSRQTLINIYSKQN
jgi:hypothetical protein